MLWTEARLCKYQQFQSNVTLIHVMNQVYFFKPHSWHPDILISCLIILFDFQTTWTRSRRCSRHWWRRTGWSTSTTRRSTVSSKSTIQTPRFATTSSRAKLRQRYVRFRFNLLTVSSWCWHCWWHDSSSSFNAWNATWYQAGLLTECSHFESFKEKPELMAADG